MVLYPNVCMDGIILETSKVAKYFGRDSRLQALLETKFGKPYAKGIQKDVWKNIGSKTLHFSLDEHCSY